MSIFPFENHIHDPAETLPREQLTGLQLQRLRQTLARVAEVPFYRQALARAKVRPESIKTLNDVRRLPFTTKEDLRQHYPLGFLAVPRARVARIHGSSGTTGRPTFVAYTAGDLSTWADLCARFLVAGGLRPARPRDPGRHRPAHARRAGRAPEPGALQRQGQARARPPKGKGPHLRMVDW